jgi:hypothetical protein
MQTLRAMLKKYRYSNLRKSGHSLIAFEKYECSYCPKNSKRFNRRWMSLQGAYQNSFLTDKIVAQNNVILILATATTQRRAGHVANKSSHA